MYVCENNTYAHPKRPIHIHHNTFKRDLLTMTIHLPYTYTHPQETNIHPKRPKYTHMRPVHVQKRPIFIEKRPINIQK